MEVAKRTITSEITELQHEKDELEMILQAHVNSCRNLKLKQGRPTTLPVAVVTTATTTPLQTPSAGFNFDFDWNNAFPSTGLTPTVSNGLITPIMTPNTVGAILGGLVKNEPQSPDVMACL